MIEAPCPVCSSQNTEHFTRGEDTHGLKCHDCGQVRKIYPDLDDYGLDYAGERDPTFNEEMMRLSYELSTLGEEIINTLREPFRRDDD